MTRTNSMSIGRPTLLAVALAISYPVFAQEVDDDRKEAIAALVAPRSEVAIGLRYLDGDSRRLGQYSGLSESGSGLLADLGLVGLDRTTGTWTRFSGRHLGQDNREAAFEQQRQGHWRYSLAYSQTPRYEPYVVNTGVRGVGPNEVTVPDVPETGVPVDLALHREWLAAGFEHALGKTSSVRLRYTHETKDGSRIYGRGTGSAIEFLPEPNDRTTETLEVTLGHAGKQFQLSGGYYGTLFVNHASTLRVNGGNDLLEKPAVPWSQMSQPLSNDSHQWFLTGGYNLTPLTRAAFKVSETIARQNETFVDVDPALLLPDVPKSLGGRVDTLLAYLDLTSREFDRIDLQANVRFEDRDDKTQVAQYMTAATPGINGGATAALPGGTAGSTGFNKPRSWTSLKSKAEAGYAFADGTRLLASLENDQQERNAPEQYRRVNFRTETDETTTSLFAKRGFLDALTASFGISEARRTGSEYLPATYDMDGNTTAAVPPSSAVNPLLWADRDRLAWKLAIDWSGVDRLALRLVHEVADDHYEGRELGPREGMRKFSSIDASYAISDRWQAHFWWSQDDTLAEQHHQVNPALGDATLRGQLWQARLRQYSEGVGGGFQGRTRKGVGFGADLAYSKQSAEHRMAALSGPDVESLPDYYYRLTEIRLFSSLPIDQASGVRFDYAYSDWKTNDWTWNGWVYADGTTLSQDDHQTAHFVGISYLYRWQ